VATDIGIVISNWLRSFRPITEDARVNGAIAAPRACDGLPGAIGTDLEGSLP
jgi:hypothetical protein